MAIDKSTWNKKVKVSQSTIDDIKKLGMDKALKLAKMNAKATQGGLVAEYQEATRRLYGDKRFAAATGAKPAAKSAASMGSKQKIYNPKYATSPSATKQKVYNPKYASKPSAAAAPKASTKYSPAPMKAPAKKDNTKSNIIKGVAGTAAAIGILALGKGKGAGIAAKLAPGLMKNKIAQAALTGEIKKAAPKVAQSSYETMVAAKRGQAAAAAGKSVTPEQFSAMTAAAKAAAKTAAKKAPAKKAAAKKAAAPAASKAKAAAKKLSAGKRFDAAAPKPKK